MHSALEHPVGGLVAGGMAATLWLRAYHLIGIRALQQDIAGMSAVERVLEARQKQDLPMPQVSVQPSVNLPWQPVLLSLAQEIPSGMANPATLSTTFSDADRLCRIASGTQRDGGGAEEGEGDEPGAAGELQQDNQGRWMFTFRLVSRVARAHLL
jgi:pilus assembly protein HofN